MTTTTATKMEDLPRIADWQPNLAGERKLLKEISAHESAHAVVGNLLGLVVSEVSVWAVGVSPELHAAKFLTADVVGCAKWKMPVGGVYTDDYLRARLLTFLAGPVQSCLSRGRPLGGHKEARDEAGALATAALLVSDEDAPALVEAARAEVFEIVFAQRAAIAALGQKLEAERTVPYPFE